MRSILPVNSGLPYGILVLEQVQSNRSGYLLTFVLVTVPTLHTEIDKTSRGWYFQISKTLYIYFRLRPGDSSHDSPSVNTLMQLCKVGRSYSHSMLSSSSHPRPRILSFLLVPGTPQSRIIRRRHSQKPTKSIPHHHTLSALIPPLRTQ